MKHRQLSALRHMHIERWKRSVISVLGERSIWEKCIFIDVFANQAYVNVDETESESRIFVRLEHYRSSKCIAYLHM